jgi:SAM-dependent methyltransferase
MFRGVERTASATELSMETLRRYPIVSEETVARDPMWEPDNYLMLGRAGLDAIRLAMLCAQKAEPSSVLDFASGYGRVTRFLRAEYPQSRLAICDIDHRAVDFCAERFGAEPLYGREHPGEVEIGEPFDLIWVCSLFTHLDEQAWHEFFEFFESAVAPGGVLVFTVHGRAIRERLRDPQYATYYLCDAERNLELANAEGGFTFREYATTEAERRELREPSRYGISLVEPSWVWRFLDRPQWKITSYIEDRWGGQDVIGAVRWEPGLRPFRQPLRHPDRDRATA